MSQYVLTLAILPDFNDVVSMHHGHSLFQDMYTLHNVNADIITTFKIIHIQNNEVIAANRLYWYLVWSEISQPPASCK